VIIRPTPRALLNAAIRYAVMAVPGLLLVYAAVASRVILPGVFGVPLAALGLFAFANAAFASIRFESGVLIGRSLLGRIAVRVDEITRIVPINLSYRPMPVWPLVGLWLVMRWSRPARMFDVCTRDGPTGLWLNPNVYGEQAVQNLLRTMHIEPETVAEVRLLQVFSLNRDYGKGSPR